MMRANVRGRLQNTHVPPSQALLPIYEAIANSVHAIEDGVGVPAGRITVVLKRSPGVLEDAPPESWPLDAIAVTDNGVGFDADNWRSFNVADSRLKESRGGRGLGRFTWLKVFIKANVASYYVEDGQTRKRSFVFRKSDEGVEDVHEELAEGPPRTTVELYGPGDDYRRAMPKGARGFADRIVEHFLPQLVLETMPRLTVADPAVGIEIDLHQTFNALVDGTRVDSFTIGGAEFELTHFIVTPDQKSSHAISLTANSRKVEEWSDLRKDITDLRGSLSQALDYAGGDGELDRHLVPYLDKDHVYYAGYLSGPFLDHHVDPSNRSSVRFPKPVMGDEDREVVTELALRAAAVDRVRDYLGPFLRPLRDAAEKRVTDKLETELPQFRSVLERRPQVIDRIGIGDSDAKIERVLYDAYSDLRREAIETAVEIQEASAEEIDSDKFAEFADTWNAVGKDELAQYVIHRRHTLDILDTYLEAPPEKRVALEAQVHKLIYPMRSTSAQPDPDSQNLWLIDERLAFHRFLASDLPMSDFEVSDIDSDRRPDLAVFNSRVALVGEEGGPYGSVSIFEFKRPHRDDYRSEEGSKDPFLQLYDYVDLMREGKAKTVGHRTIEVTRATRFYLYLVADITPTLKKIIRRRGGMKPTADGQGFYELNEEYNAYVEVMGWPKLLRDARKRNEVLFHKLGLPKHISA